VTGVALGDPFVSVVSSGTLLTFDFPFEKMVFHRFENSSADTEKGLGELPLPLILATSLDCASLVLHGLHESSRNERSGKPPLGYLCADQQ
jgi:hypothetical protein